MFCVNYTTFNATILLRVSCCLVGDVELNIARAELTAYCRGTHHDEKQQNMIVKKLLLRLLSSNKHYNCYDRFLELIMKCVIQS